MNRSLLLILNILLSCICVYADTQGDNALVALSERLHKLGDYQTSITLKAKDTTLEGHYRISGEDYHINMGSVEYWGQGDYRYEVSHKIEEIIVERASSGSNMLLSNPSKAFDFVGQGFDAVVEQGGTLLRLTPKSEGGVTLDVDRVLIYLDKGTLLPTKIVYEADADSIVVEFRDFKGLKGGIVPFDRSKYKRYEVVEL